MLVRALLPAARLSLLARQMSTLVADQPFRPPEPSNDAIELRRANGERLAAFLQAHKGSITAITGAGISTESSMPDYRSPLGAYNRGHVPMTYQAFVAYSPVSLRTPWHQEASADPTALAAAHRRQRYWLRSYLGFPRVNSIKPNHGHLFLTELQQRGLVNDIVTQNVDRLHHKSGARNITELHGHLFSVSCLHCHSQYPRALVQQWMKTLNDKVIGHIDEDQSDAAAYARPDGDVAIEIDPTQFCVPNCPACRGGLLKPSVVFFGESIAKDIVEQSYDAVHRASALLVLGTSLEVASAFRLIRRAIEQGKPYVVVNIGATRGDALSHFKVEDRVSAALEQTIACL